MSFVRTVLGDIPAEQLGVCYAHEHIIIERGYVTDKWPEYCLDSVDMAVQELREYYAVDGRAMVDSMPCDAGRNVVKLADVSRQSGVHIVCPTGLHLEKYYPPQHWSQRASVDELKELFVNDIEIGIDAEDYGSPIVRRTPHRAGVIKVAGGLDALSEHEQKIFIAAAQAHSQTGCPILTHTEQGTAAIEQIKILKKNGADLRHVVLSHTDRKPDLSYHRELLSTGVNLEYDSVFRWQTEHNPTFSLVMQLLPEYPNQILLGMDAARRSYWKSYGGAPGLCHLLTDFLPRLHSAGLSEVLIDNLFVGNPARIYCFMMAAGRR